MDQFEIIWILVIVIGALNYDLNASGSNSLLTGAFLFIALMVDSNNQKEVRK